MIPKNNRVCCFCVCFTYTNLFDGVFFQWTKNKRSSRICNQKTDRSVMIDALWQDEWDKNGFQSSFFEAINAQDINMMQYLAENPKSVLNFGQTKWNALHTISFGMRGHQINVHANEQVWKQLFIKQKDNQFQFSKCGYLPIHLACQTNNVTVLQLIIDSMDKTDLVKLLKQVTKNKYWQFTPLMIAIEKDSIDCVRILCNFDKIDLNVRSRYPNYDALEFACYCNNINALKIILSKINNNDIFTPQKIQEMLEIAKCGSTRVGSLHKECIEFISSIVTATTTTKEVHPPDKSNLSVFNDLTTIATTIGDSNNVVFDYRSSRKAIVNSTNYICDNCACKSLILKEENSKPFICSICKQTIDSTKSDIGYSCGKCYTMFCQECVFVVSIIYTQPKDKLKLMRNREFITLLRNDEKTVAQV